MIDHYLHLLPWLLAILSSAAIVILCLRIRILKRERDYWAIDIFEQIAVGIFLRDLSGRIICCNQSLLNAIDLPRQDVIGKKISELGVLGLEDGLRLDSDFKLFVEAGGDGVEIREFSINVAGRKVSLRQWDVLCVDKTGKPFGVMSGGVDITHLTEMLTQLHEAYISAKSSGAAKGQFLAVMSHEIRTPLYAIVSTLELALLKIDRGEPLSRDLIQLSHESSKSLLRLTGDILDLAKVESQALHIEPAPCDLVELVQSNIMIFEGRATERGLTITSEISEGVPSRLLVDGPRLGQVLSNLISNAIKFTQHGGIKICLLAKEVEGKCTVQLEVHDTGEGIPKDKQEKLFRPFSQLCNGDVKLQGAGLGLMVSRLLVEKMAGRLWLESNHGEGAHFFIELLCDAVHEAAEPLPEIDQELNSDQPQHILVVDDHLASRELLCQQLEFLGHTTCQAQHGVEALGLMQQQKFDLVMTDCNMPVMGGVELVKNIRRIGYDCFVVGLTANAQDIERERCIDVGMNECLFKPINLQALRKALSDVRMARVKRLPKLHPAGSIKFDYNKISELIGGDVALAKKVIDKLYLSNQDDIARLNLGVCLNRWSVVSGIIHRIKGAARMVGAEVLLEAIDRYEESAVDEVAGASLRKHAYEVRSALLELQAELSTWLHDAQNEHHE